MLSYSILRDRLSSEIDNRRIRGSNVNDSQITIFYSWQFDLPGSDTRNIIQDSIKDVVRILRDTIDIEADRDAKAK